MGISTNLREQFIEFDSNKIPISKNGRLLSDVYVELPNNKRFIRYICNGDLLEENHLKVIKNHSIPKFFVLINEIEEFKHLNNSINSQIEHVPINYDKTPKEIKFHSENDAEFLKVSIANDLMGVLHECQILSPQKITLEKSGLSKTADKLLKVISPELQAAREQLKRIPAYIDHIEDSATITALSTLFAIAKGQNSRSTFKDLAHACLFMDIGLVELKAEDKNRYWSPLESLPKSLQKKILNHPMRSYEIIQKKFLNFPDIVAQMIVGHHELFNGQGYPRKVRSELLAPMVRLLAFSVDVFEHMKRQKLQSLNPSVEDSVKYFLEEPVEPHMRRHNLTLCREIWNFIQENNTQDN